jgi:hypothetical protein
MKFKKGDRLRVVRGMGIIATGEMGTVVEKTLGGVAFPCCELLIHFDKDKARGLGPIALNRKDWSQRLERC